MAKRSISTTPLWIISLLGIVVTALGVYLQVTESSSTQQMFAGTLSAVGGGVIGAAISIFFAAGEGRDTLLAVRDLLTGSLRAEMHSAEEALRPLRREWHYYHLTQRDGTFLWRYTNYHFDRSNLASSIVLLTKDASFGREHTYRTEVAVRGDRLIMVETPEDGSEPPIVGVVPFFTESFRKVRAGVVMMRSWDGADVLSKCVWSPTALAVAENGDVRSEDAPILEDAWTSSFRESHRIFPSAFFENAHPASGLQPDAGTA